MTQTAVNDDFGPCVDPLGDPNHTAKAKWDFSHRDPHFAIAQMEAATIRLMRITAKFAVDDQIPPSEARKLVEGVECVIRAASAICLKSGLDETYINLTNAAGRLSPPGDQALPPS